jgi:hypothetical protein
MSVRNRSPERGLGMLVEREFVCGGTVFLFAESLGSD